MGRAERDRKKITYPPEIIELAEQVGGFIEYWGFKRIHGRIWVYLFLSDTPLDAGDLLSRLKITKGFLSIALAELQQYQVILEAGISESGTQLYQANSNLTQVILNVLRKRERMMLAHLASVAKIVGNIRPSGKQKLCLSPPRIRELEAMIQAAQNAVEAVVTSEKAETIPLSTLLGGFLEA